MNAVKNGELHAATIVGGCTGCGDLAKWVVQTAQRPLQERAGAQTAATDASGPSAWRGVSTKYTGDNETLCRRRRPRPRRPPQHVMDTIADLKLKRLVRVATPALIKLGSTTEPNQNDASPRYMRYAV